MSRVNFTAKYIDSFGIPKGKKRVEVTDSKVPSLTLRVGSSGKKVFYKRFREGEKVKRKRLGVYPEMNVSSARIAAGKFEHEGKTDNYAKEDSNTLNQLFENYVKEYLPKLKASTSTDYQNRLKRYVLPELGGKKLNQIDKVLIERLLFEIAKETPTTANRVKAILSSMFSYGVYSNQVTQNPVSSVKFKEKERVRDRVYTDEEMKKILYAIDTIREPYKSNIKLIIYTGQRVSEINSLKWSDISEDRINIRAENTKNSLGQIIPIVQGILLILKNIESSSKDYSEYLFPIKNNKNKHRTSMSKVLKHIKNESGVLDFRLHDIRTQMVSKLSEKGVSRTVVGKLLNHKQLSGDNSVTGMHYDKHSYYNQKIEALELWIEYLENLLGKFYTNKKLSKWFS